MLLKKTLTSSVANCDSYFLLHTYTYVHDQWESIPFYLPGEKQRDLYLDDLRMYV